MNERKEALLQKTVSQNFPKAETLKYMSNLGQFSVDQMKHFRAKFYDLACSIESLGNSREMSLAFTHLEISLMYSIKHLCLVDPEKKFEDVA